ncbi:MAG: hypothetical protein HW388_19 [Dehalococcoidia bacterium]|nr:hypothetical protein [Dehalococcoidia bacterium]
MLRILTLVMDVIFLGLLIFALVALWGFRDTNSVEDVTALIRVSKGQVTILDPVKKTEHKGDGLQTLRVGQTVRVDNGSDAFLFYADGDVSRLIGPVGARLNESQRTVRKPAILSSLK